MGVENDDPYSVFARPGPNGEPTFVAMKYGCALSRHTEDGWFTAQFPTHDEALQFIEKDRKK